MATTIITVLRGSAAKNIFKKNKFWFKSIIVTHTYLASVLGKRLSGIYQIGTYQPASAAAVRCDSNGNNNNCSVERLHSCQTGSPAHHDVISHS